MDRETDLERKSRLAIDAIRTRLDDLRNVIVYHELKNRGNCRPGADRR